MTDPASTRRIHFISDITETEDGYECQRCGWEGRSPADVYTHRHGVFSNCWQRRLKDFVGISE